MEDYKAAVASEDAPESWEVTDVESSMRHLLLSPGNDSDDKQNEAAIDSGYGSGLGLQSDSVTPDDLINKVDQFLREAIQNPRERLSVLRMEQEVERFIHDPTREQMEFKQLPTSYLRLAAHRVAQHYSLPSMVLVDNSLPDGSCSRIIVQKTSNIQLPLIRLAEIPVDLATEESGVVKVAIKQRPQKGSLGGDSDNDYSNAQSTKSNNSKSVEERKEEYNKARARIFSPNCSSGISHEKPVDDPQTQDSSQLCSLRTMTTEQKHILDGGSVTTIGRSLSDSSTSSTSTRLPKSQSSSISSSRLPKSQTEKELVGRPKTNNRVAIFRDQEVDRKDPDYDRSYDRYMQRFDPGFGISCGPYSIQPMYVAAANYNTEFPLLGSSHTPLISSEPPPYSFPQHLSEWVSPSTPAGIGYSSAENMLSPFGSDHVNSCSNSGLYMNPIYYPCQRPYLPYMHPLEQIHQPFSQSHQQQPDASFGLAWPR